MMPNQYFAFDKYFVHDNAEIRNEVLGEVDYMNEIARRLSEGVDEAVENYRFGAMNKSGETKYSQSDIDKFTERTYNNYGWVSVNDVLSSQALRRMYSQFASIKTGAHYDKTIDGYYIIPTGDYDKVLNIFV